MITELAEPAVSHTIKLRDLMQAVARKGGNLNTEITIEADGEPVSIYAFLPESRPWGFDFSKIQFGG